MDDGMYSEFMSYLATPGKISESAWRDAYFVRTLLESGSQEKALCQMISVISRVARSRRERLPDYLHNMMILNSGGAGEYHADREWSKKQVLAYVKMLGHI